MVDVESRSLVARAHLRHQFDNSRRQKLPTVRIHGPIAIISCSALNFRSGKTARRGSFWAQNSPADCRQATDRSNI